MHFYLILIVMDKKNINSSPYVIIVFLYIYKWTLNLLIYFNQLVYGDPYGRHCLGLEHTRQRTSLYILVLMKGEPSRINMWQPPRHWINRATSVTVVSIQTSFNGYVKNDIRKHCNIIVLLLQEHYRVYFPNAFGLYCVISQGRSACVTSDFNCWHCSWGRPPMAAVHTIIYTKYHLTLHRCCRWKTHCACVFVKTDTMTLVFSAEIKVEHQLYCCNLAWDIPLPQDVLN